MSSNPFAVRHLWFTSEWAHLHPCRLAIRSWRGAMLWLGMLAVLASQACLAAAWHTAARLGPRVAAQTPAPDHWRQWRGVLYRVLAPPSPAPSLHGPPLRGPVSFLLGTVHFGSLQELWLDEAVLREALGRSRLFVDEAAMPDGPWPPDWHAYRELPAGQSLPLLLGDAAFAQLRGLLDGLPAETLARMKPWAVLALLETRGEPAGEHTLDRRLLRWAHAQPLPIHHLESLPEQLQALDCVPAERHVQVLRQRLATPWLFAEQSRRVLEYYRAGDLPAWLDEVDAMVGLDAEARAIEQAARRCLIEARNARWLVRLEPLLRGTSAFVAVGAIHLTGEEGLLQALRQRGFGIEAMPMSMPWLPDADVDTGEDQEKEEP